MNTPSIASPGTMRSSHGWKAFTSIVSRCVLLAISAVAVAWSGGCATAPSTYQPLNTTKYTLENTDRFELLDSTAQNAVTCTGLQERSLADGRLEIVANLKNRENRRLEIQANCAFKNAEGFATGDETPWQTILLAENATQAVRFTAANAVAKKYTVRVRQSR